MIALFFSTPGVVLPGRVLEHPVQRVDHRATHLWPRGGQETGLREQVMG